MRKICIVTGTRAEWGLLSGLAARLRRTEGVRLQIVATNMHLSEKYGRTVDEIRADGFEVDAAVPMIDDAAPADATETVRAMGREMQGFADAFSRLAPDLVVILGDRYEMLVAASAALIFGIPIAHLHGGEKTEGAFDDSIRHAITKLSTLHFTATEDYRARVIQMGEPPERVFCSGAIGCENIRATPRLTKDEVEASLDFRLTDKCFLVTYHPVTVGGGDGAAKTRELLAALDAFPDYRVVITHPNSDKGRDGVLTVLAQYARERPDRVKLVPSLGARRYLSLIPLVCAVVGNSSSGLIEVPSFGVPTVNVGSRQDGRTRGLSVIDCAEDASSIRAAIEKALSPDFRARCRGAKNPYEKPGTIEMVAHELVTADLESLRHKRFYDLPKGEGHV